MYYVYVIYSVKLKRRYIGFTEDLQRRFEEHNCEKDTFTSKGLPWKLIYYQAFISKKDAMAEERFLKTGKGRERMKFLFSNINFEELKN